MWDTAFTIVNGDETKSFLDALATIPEENLIQTLRENVYTTQNGVLGCVKTHGKRVSWPLGQTLPPKKMEKPKMATNAHLAMPRKLIVINQLFFKLVARRSNTLAGGHVKIHRIVEKKTRRIHNRLITNSFMANLSFTRFCDYSTVSPNKHGNSVTIFTMSIPPPSLAVQ